jgi:hypothetical protein
MPDSIETQPTNVEIIGQAADALAGRLSGQTTDEQPVAETPTPPTEEAPEEDPETPATGTAAEAKKYRQRAAALKTANEGLTAEIEELRASYVSEVVKAALRDPSDFALNVSAETLLDPQTGRLDPSLVKAALEDLLEKKPHLSSDRPAPRRRPTLPKGNPAASRSRPATSGEKSLAERFGAEGGASWGGVLDRQSEIHERAIAGTSKTRLKLSTEE